MYGQERTKKVHLSREYLYMNNVLCVSSRNLNRLNLSTKRFKIPSKTTTNTLKNYIQVIKESEHYEY